MVIYKGSKYKTIKFSFNELSSDIVGDGTGAYVWLTISNTYDTYAPEGLTPDYTNFPITTYAGVVDNFSENGKITLTKIVSDYFFDNSEQFLDYAFLQVRVVDSTDSTKVLAKSNVMQIRLKDSIT